MAQEKPKAEHEIVDLDTREVSVVDKPAIRRTFLVVKSQEGNLEVIRQEDQTMGNKGEAQGETDILDLLDVSIIKTEQGTPNKSVDRLMSLATILKSETGEAISEGACDELCSIAEDLSGNPVNKEEASKLSPKDAEGKVNKAVGQMMVIAKNSEDELTEEAKKEMSDIASELVPAVKAEDGEVAPSDAPFQIFVGQGKDPDILIQKAGAKMKASRLSAFEKAVNTLVTLLTEIKGEQPKQDKTKKSNEEDPVMSKEEKKETTEKKEEEKSEENTIEKKEEETPKEEKVEETKKEEASPTKDWMESIAKQIGEIGSKVEEMGKTLTEKFDSVSKRVDEMEEVSGETDGDPEQTEKKEKPFWGGRIVPR